MAIFYIDAVNGNDANAGTSKEAPFQTLARVNTWNWRSGDQCLFRKGQTWYGFINMVGNPRQVTDAPVTVGSYGQGARPIISGYKKINTNAWVLHATGVWKMDINDASKFTGNTMVSNASFGSNIGFLRVDGVIKGFKKPDLASLANDWDFFSDNVNFVLYVKSATDPGTRAAEIMAAPRQNTITPNNGTRYIGLEFNGTGGHVHGGATSDVDFEGCILREIGGCYLTGTLRYGNGVQLYSTNSSNVVTTSARVNIRRNLFVDIYDVAFTMQGGGIVNATDGWEDIVFSENKMVRCTQGIEIWNRYDINNGNNVGVPAAGSGFRRCRIANNTDIDTGRGFGNAEPTPRDNAASLLIYNIEAPVCDVTVDNNTHINPTRGLFHQFPVPADYVWRQSRFIGKKETPLDTTYVSSVVTDLYTLETLGAYISDTGRGLRTKFQALDETLPNSTRGTLARVMGYIMTLVAQAEQAGNHFRSLAADVMALRGQVDGIVDRTITKSYTTAQLQTLAKPDGTLVHCSDLGGQGGMVEAFQSLWRRVGTGGVADIATDANDVVTYLNSAGNRRYTGVMAANRVTSVTETTLVPGAKMRFTRAVTATGAFTRTIQLAVTPFTNYAVLTNPGDWVEIEVTNNAPYHWVLTAKGNIS